MSDLEVSLSGTVGGFALAAEFSAPMQGITGLFGPSGSGKTSILRCIAGLTRLPEATVRAGDATWQDSTRFVPPASRGAGFVFQEGALFPHLNVRRNLAYAQHRAPAGRIGFDAVIEMLDLAPLLGRVIADLSGGERQRVTIGRALLSQPSLLLLDEPCSALDHPARDQIIGALERLSAELAVPMLFVTHDLAEMARAADRLVLIDQGRAIGAGSTAAILTDLELPLASLPHALSVLDGKIESYDPAESLTRIEISGHTWLVPGTSATPGAKCRLRVMASDVGLSRAAPSGTTILNMPLARIVSAAAMPQTGQVNVVVRLGAEGLGQTLLARVSHKSWESLAFQSGECIHLLIKGVGLVDPA